MHVDLTHVGWNRACGSRDGVYFVRSVLWLALPISISKYLGTAKYLCISLIGGG